MRFFTFFASRDEAMALFTSVGDFLDFFTAMIIGDSITARLTKGLLLFGSWRKAKEIFFFKKKSRPDDTRRWTRFVLLLDMSIQYVLTT